MQLPLKRIIPGVLFFLAYMLFHSMTSSASPLPDKRVFNPVLDGRWIGNGISYSAYRDGEDPDMEGTTSRADILEDRDQPLQAHRKTHRGNGLAAQLLDQPVKTSTGTHGPLCTQAVGDPLEHRA